MLATNKNKAKLYDDEIAIHPVELTKKEFERAVKNNAIEGTYDDYLKEWRKNNISGKNNSGRRQVP